jgi:F0F1-type ATP synthase assembly protein I
MPAGSEEPRKFGLYLALGQAGLEMVAPLGLGVWLDWLLGWTPWLTLCGIVIGFVGGLTHMIVIANRLNSPDAATRSRQPEKPVNRGPQ